MGLAEARGVGAVAAVGTEGTAVGAEMPHFQEQGEVMGWAGVEEAGEVVVEGEVAGEEAAAAGKAEGGWLLAGVKGAVLAEDWEEGRVVGRVEAEGGSAAAVVEGGESRPEDSEGFLHDKQTQQIG